MKTDVANTAPEPAPPNRAMMNRRPGFTLIELLVVISIIALLIGILLPALSRARSSAQELRSKSDLRQLSVGYTAYQNDYQGHLMFGYPPATLYSTNLTVEFAGHTFQPPISRRYPWRLLPYVSGVWEVLHNHTDTPDIPKADDATNIAFKKAYDLSVYPSYGMNDIFVGGHSGFGGFVEVTTNHYEPAYGQHAIFHNSEVRRMSDLIVLGESQFNLGYEPQQGFLHLTPPYARGEQWRVEGGEFKATVQTPVGFPKGRYGPDAAMAFFDGHVQGMSPMDLRDMRYWANNATTEDYDFLP